MRNNKDKALAQKIAEINSLWDNEDKYISTMPAREMFCMVDFESEDECCIVHKNENCPMPDMIILNQVSLDSNADWLSWELEMMD